MTGRHRAALPYNVKASIAAALVAVGLAATIGIVSITVADGEMPAPRSSFIWDGSSVRDDSIGSTGPSSAP